MTPNVQMPFDRPFHEWLWEQLRSRNMSQRQLATLSGIEHSSVSRILAGRDPMWRTAVALFSVFAEPEPQPTRAIARVEQALRSDPLLTANAIRGLMFDYLEAREPTRRHVAHTPRPLPAPQPVGPRRGVPTPSVRRLDQEVAS